MKLHASVGADILSAIDFPYPVVPIVRHHHESWDGTGYPDKLAGAAIPIGARILSVVDCFDALTSDRPYRPRLSDKDALRILGERRGHMYDPLVVDTFVRLHADGGLRASEATHESSFATFTSSSFPNRAPNRASRLEDITASGEEMLALFELARSLNNRVSPSDIGDVIVKHLRRVVPSSLFVFYVHDVDADELVSSYASGEHSGIVGGLRIPLGQRLTGWVGAHRQTIRNSDPVLDLGEAARAVSPRLRSCLSTPLSVGDSLIGVLSLYSSGHEAFSDDHQRIVEVIARQVSPAFQQALTLDRSRRPVMDPGLSSLEQLELIASSQVITEDAPMSLILIDVGGLGELNTRYGREVADDALSHVVKCIRRHVRPADALFRYQNDQLLVIQFQTDARLAAAMAERIRQAVETESVDARAKTRLRLAVGVSTMPEDGQSIEALIVAAKRRIGSPPGRQLDDLSQPPESIHWSKSCFGNNLWRCGRRYSGRALRPRTCVP